LFLLLTFWQALLLRDCDDSFKMRSLSESSCSCVDCLWFLSQSPGNKRKPDIFRRVPHTYVSAANGRHCRSNGESFQPQLVVGVFHEWLAVTHYVRVVPSEELESTAFYSRLVYFIAIRFKLPLMCWVVWLKSSDFGKFFTESYQNFLSSLILICFCVFRVSLKFFAEKFGVPITYFSMNVTTMSNKERKCQLLGYQTGRIKKTKVFFLLMNLFSP